MVVFWSGYRESAFDRTDPDRAMVPLYSGVDVANQGSYEELAEKPGVMIYTLLVSNASGGTTVAAVTVNVSAIR